MDALILLACIVWPELSVQQAQQQQLAKKKYDEIEYIKRMKRQLL